MRKWAEKLQRLPAPRVEAPAAAIAAAPCTASHDVLAELRARMQALKEEARPVRPLTTPLTQGEVDALPFVAEGQVWSRRVVLGPEHRAGVVPTSLALQADPQFLALLALDPSVSGCSPRRALYLDLETTGLSQQGAVPFLVGLAYVDEQVGRLVLEQLLLKNLDDEAALLARVAERMARAELLITFNGKSFDWPLLRARFQLARLPVPSAPAHLDLLQIAKRVHKPVSGKRSIRLQSLENDLLGLERQDDIPGADIGAAYWHWLRTGQDAVMRAVVDHNAWDMYAMAALVGLYGRPVLAEPEHPGQVAGLADFLPQVAWTLKRAGEPELARRVANQAVERSGDFHAYLARAQIAKALRDRDAALGDYEQALVRATPGATGERVRLELCKLYEHHTRAYGRAREVAAAGTGEDADKLQRRLERLAHKEQRASAPRARQTTPKA